MDSNVPLNKASTARRSSTKASDKPPKPKATDGEHGSGTSAAVSKRKQTKSRNGCITCKAKRLKCDEKHPTCEQCERRGVPCGGYKKEFKWKSVEETRFGHKSSKSSIISFQSSTDVPTLSDYGAHGSLVPIPPIDSGAPYGQRLLPQGSSQLLPADFKVASQHYANPVPTPSRGRYGQEDLPQSLNRSPSSNYQSGMARYADSRSSPSSATMAIVFQEGDMRYSPISPGTAPSSRSSGQSPRLVDLLLPGTDMNAPSPEYDSFRAKQPDSAFASPILQPRDREFNEDHNDIEEIEREDSINMSFNHRFRRESSPSSSSSSGTSLELAPFLLKEIPFGSNSQERLAMNYDRNTCGILSMMDGPNENPWRTLVWPLAKGNKALFHALASMTSFHEWQGNEKLRIQGIDHMRTSIKLLRQNLPTMKVDEAMATTLALAFAESWDSNVSTGIQHIKGAKTLFNSALALRTESNMSPTELTRMKFLCNSWIYLDVIARLTSVDDDESNDFDAYLFKFTPPTESIPQLDPLMGCASTLFPVIGRVANLVRRVKRPCTDARSPNIISQGVELKEQLLGWVPPDYFDDPEDPSLQLQHAINTAEAYRYATMLHLHQAVPDIPMPTSAELSREVLKQLAYVPLKSRSIIVQIYPLMAAGSEAVTEEDREWVLKRWRAMSDRMKIGIIDRCEEIVKEVWIRRDAYLSERRESAQPPSLKRAHPDDDDEGYGDGKRRIVDDACEWPKSFTIHGYERRSSPNVLDHEYTVNGQLHWLGVMKDRGWEVLLG